MITEFTIENDCVAPFRSALEGVLPAHVARDGTIVFLKTKVFGGDYIAFLDDCATKPSYSQARRDVVERRKRALEPHLGQPMLHGLVSHGALDYNIFVDKLALRVIHFELHAQPGAHEK